MSWLHCTFILAFVAQTCASSHPAVRVRVTQKGLSLAIDSAMEHAKKQLKNYPLPDTKGTLFAFDYSFTDMTIFNIDIRNQSLRSVPRTGLYSILRNIDFDIKGKWTMNMGLWFSNYGTFTVAVRGMSVAILMHLGVNGDRLVVSNITCASKLANINVNLKAGQTTSFLFPLVQGAVNSFVKSKIPAVACEEGKKALRKNLNKQFAKFPVKQNLKKSVTLDYSVVKKPEYQHQAVDLFLKGEFQPSDGHMTWQHQPAPLPYDGSRDRMMYVTIMDHMINSASHAYYNQDAMKVKVAVKQQTPQLLPKTGFLGRYLSRVNAGLGLIKQSACSNCDLYISISATSPPQIRTNHSGIHLTVHLIAKINVVLGNSKEDVLDLETNVSATAIPKLNGTKLSTNITDFKIDMRVINATMLSTLSGRVPEMKRIVKEKIEKVLENGISGMEIPLPLSEKFQLVKPEISYGEGYMTLETDVLVI